LENIRIMYLDLDLKNFLQFVYDYIRMSLRISKRNAVHRSSKNIPGRKKIILILGIWGPNVLFNVYNLQNIWHFSIFIENTLYVQLVSCRNRTVGFYEEKLKKALESYIFLNNRSNHYLYKLQKGFGRLFLRHYNYG